MKQTLYVLPTPITDAAPRLVAADGKIYVPCDVAAGLELKLAAALEAARPEEKASGVFVPLKAWQWLMGLGDDFQPPEPTDRQGRFWWRSELRRRIEAEGGTSTPSPRGTYCDAAKDKG